jgi:hypothetical protein
LKEGLKSGHLHNTEVFLFTDNTAAEAAYVDGTSESKLLFNLALDLCILEMSGLLQLYVIHVAGSRMISQGTDALSCGALSDGIMRDGDMLRYVSLHLHALGRQPTVLDWVQDWTGQPNLLPLTPDAWYRSDKVLRGSISNQKNYSPPSYSENLPQLLPMCA